VGGGGRRGAAALAQGTRWAAHAVGTSLESPQQIGGQCRCCCCCCCGGGRPPAVPWAHLRTGTWCAARRLGAARGRPPPPAAPARAWATAPAAAAQQAARRPRWRQSPAAQRRQHRRRRHRSKRPQPRPPGAPLRPAAAVPCAAGPGGMGGWAGGVAHHEPRQAGQQVGERLAAAGLGHAHDVQPLGQRRPALRLDGRGLEEALGQHALLHDGVVLQQRGGRLGRGGAAGLPPRARRLGGRRGARVQQVDLRGHLGRGAVVGALALLLALLGLLHRLLAGCGRRLGHVNVTGRVLRSAGGGGGEGGGRWWAGAQARFRALLGWPRRGVCVRGR
jgi:hypothetical protein